MNAAQNETVASWLTLPNLLTAFRLVLVPLFLQQIINGRRIEALLIFLLAGLTDLLDGFVARTWNVRTALGKILDPAADKLLLVTAFVATSIPRLSQPYHMPVWLAATVVSRDSLIALGALVLFLWKGVKTFTPSLWGKICTFLQVLTVLLVLAGNAIIQAGPNNLSFLQWLASSTLQTLFFAATFLATVLSGVQYTAFGLKKAFFSSEKKKG